VILVLPVIGELRVGPFSLNPSSEFDR